MNAPLQNIIAADESTFGKLVKASSDADLATLVDGLLEASSDEAIDEERARRKRCAQVALAEQGDRLTQRAEGMEA